MSTSYYRGILSAQVGRAIRNGDAALEPQRKYLESLTEQIMTEKALETRQPLIFTKSQGKLSLPQCLNLSQLFTEILGQIPTEC